MSGSFFDAGADREIFVFGISGNARENGSARRRIAPVSESPSGNRALAGSGEDISFAGVEAPINGIIANPAHTNIAPLDAMSFRLRYVSARIADTENIQRERGTHVPIRAFERRQRRLRRNAR
jgi:hypothetical protein